MENTASSYIKEEIKMTIIVTGGAGFIGSNLSRHLIKNDMEVSIASDVYQGTYQYDELVDMQFVENAQKQN